MSGTIPLSLTQQLDQFGAPLNGGLLYLIQAGTVSTPQNGFQDPALTLVLPNPITMDSAGRLPQFFLADGFIKIRMTNSAGLIQREADNIQVIGPSAGGGGGGTSVDQNALIQTGNIIVRYGTGALPGYVRMNGNSIGSQGTSATERGNADCQALWIYLYNTDPNLAVSGGRAIPPNALNDWLASKLLTLPDCRGRVIAGLDDMGAVAGAAGRLTSTYFGAVATTLGLAGGADHTSSTITQGNLPSFNMTSGSKPVTIYGRQITNIVNGSGTTVAVDQLNNASPGGSVSQTTLETGGQTVPSGGMGTALLVNGLQPMMIMTFYMKL